MSGDTELPPLPELRREDCRPEPRDLAEVVVSRGGGGGVGLLEAFLHCYFKPELVEKATHFYTQIVPVAEGVDESTALLIWGKLVILMEETAGEPLSATFRIPLSAGMFTVMAIPAGQSEPVKLPTDTALRGHVGVWSETISDYRTGHKTRYSNVKLTPTDKAIKLFPKFNHAGAFTAALDLLGCWVARGAKERLITATKAELYAYLEKQHRGQFGTFETFARNYTSGGRRALDLKFSINWMEDRRRDS